MMRISTVAIALALRPWLWPIAIRQALRISPARWWLKVPPLPAPDSGYMRMRSIIAYGGDGRKIPDAGDIVRYLEWCRDAGRYIR